jgi:hypothetical protein
MTPKLSFNVQRDEWIKQYLADHDLPNEAVRVLTAIALYFNREHFEQSGSLVAWPGIRKLAKAAGLHSRSMRRGRQDAVERGHLKITHRLHPARPSENDTDFYEAVLNPIGERNTHTPPQRSHAPVRAHTLSAIRAHPVRNMRADSLNDSLK